MQETSNSFDAALVTAMCITVTLQGTDDDFTAINSLKGTILTHIIKTDDTKIIEFAQGGLRQVFILTI